MSSTPQVDLTQVSLLSELVLRGGDISNPRAQQDVRAQYARTNTSYPDLAAGLSCLFRPGATMDQLAREGFYPNAKLSVTIIKRLIDELAHVGCEPALYSTPTPASPDHHTLVFLRGGTLELQLHDDVLAALVRAMMVLDNPYRRQMKR